MDIFSILFNEAILISTHNIPFLNMKKKKENHPKLFQIYIYGICSKGLKKEFETAVVNEPSVFEPLKFYCKYVQNLSEIIYHKIDRRM